MYGPNDPRARLGQSQTKGTNSSVAEPQYFEFAKIEPDRVSELGSLSWLVRAQNAVLEYVQTKRGETFEHSGRVDEHMLLIPSASDVRIAAGDEQAMTVDGPAIVIVPPGESSYTVGAEAELVRLFSVREADLANASRNAEAYSEPHANVAPLEPWPEPPSGFAVRVYRLDDVPEDSDRFGNIFRSTCFMVNWMPPEWGPRNTNEMSPHSHDDFEQISLTLEGDYVHHIRTPWTRDLSEWRDDHHAHTSSPSVTIIPPPAIHTSQAVGHQRHHLIDIFSPPRVDFSKRDGWVLNADEYPMPSK